MKSKNERVTEYLVMDLLRDLGYLDDEEILVEPQKSANPEIQKYLKNASKSGEGIGKPEFIITSQKHPDFLIVVECKADINQHQSISREFYKDFAVDGVLSYASYLSKVRNVIAIAVSGYEKNDLVISTFLWIHNAPTYKDLKDSDKKAITKLLTFDRYVEYSTTDPKLKQTRFEDLISFSKDVHNFMRDYAKLSETEKPLLVSGILIALMNDVFSRNYQVYNQKNGELANELGDVIIKEIKKMTIRQANKESMMQPYSFISVHPELRRLNPKTNETPLLRLIKDIDQHVKPFIKKHGEFDVLGQFYGEFLRYTGGDKKGLGIVLTPKHITELFAKLANLTKTSTVLDICAGTAGYLISSMHEMLDKAKSDEEKLHIRQNCLIGVEQQPNMYALAASNMVLRGDGKANLYQGDCFDTIPSPIKH